MDYAQEQRNPTKHLVGIVVVVLLHVALVYALVNGLATKVIEVIKKPLETQIIEEIKPPPPPPPQVLLPPPPKFVTPPPPYIPPPEVQVNVPPPPNAIATTTSVVPTESPPIAAVAPPAAVAAPAAPVAKSAKSACPNYAKAMGDDGFPKEAIREGISRGDALVRFTVTGSGEIKDVVAVNASNRYFGRAAVATVKNTFKCIGQGQDIVFEIPFGYSLN